MKSVLLNRVTALFVAMLSAYILVSCVQEEYEVSEENLNLEVTVFQEGVELPLGSTDKIKIGEILEKYAPEIAQDYTCEDGTYAFNMSETLDFSEDLSYLSESFAIDGFSEDKKYPFVIWDGKALAVPDPASSASVAFRADIPESVINLGGKVDQLSLPEELVYIGDILFKDTFLDLTTKVIGLEGLSKNVEVTLDLDITVPEMIILENSQKGGVVKRTGTIVGDVINIEPVRILGLDVNKNVADLSKFLKDVKLSYSGSVFIEAAVSDIVNVDNLELDVNLSLMTDGSDNMIEISKVTGKVDCSIEPVSVDMDLSSLANALKTDDFKLALDLNRYSLALELKTNLSIPIFANMSITPYKDGVAGTPHELPEPLKIDVPESAGEPAVIRYWVSNFKGEDPYMPAGYTHVTFDILSLIADIPDKLELTLSAGTDPEAEASIAHSDEGPVLEASYSFNLPFEFGEDMALEFSTIISNVPEELGTILKYGSLALTGEIESTLPLGLDMTCNFLDSKGNKIDLAENAGKQAIQPGTISGEAVKTDLNILVGVKKNADLSDIDSIELVFKTLSVAGAPVKKDSYIKAKLQARVPEGVTLDLKDFMSNE
jgi:hypothetical protein